MLFFQLKHNYTFVHSCASLCSGMSLSLHLVLCGFRCAESFALCALNYWQQSHKVVYTHLHLFEMVSSLIYLDSMSDERNLRACHPSLHLLMFSWLKIVILANTFLRSLDWILNQSIILIGCLEEEDGTNCKATSRCSRCVFCWSHEGLLAL